MAPPAAEPISFWDISHLYPVEWEWGNGHLFLLNLCSYNYTTCHLACVYWGRRQTYVVINCNCPELRSQHDDKLLR